jgi:aminoglycoside phosphotransferase (APT) family kinase protein
VERRWERAHEFLELPTAAIEARVRALYPAAGLKDAQPLYAGLRNTNYRLTVGGGLSLLALRLYVADPAACAREAAVLTHVAGRVLAPRVLGMDTAANPPFALLEWLEGEPLGRRAARLRHPHGSRSSRRLRHGVGSNSRDALPGARLSPPRSERRAADALLGPFDPGSA